jgi:DHA1 family bicyclomycin/chloramphenicol resistance-like MFS transporter
MALAPMIGNWISLHYGWRANFILIAVLAIVTVICTATLIKETLPVEKRNQFKPRQVFKDYVAILGNFPYMAHSMIWCLMFSLVIVFIANLSLIFIDYLLVPKEIFGYYQAAIMSTFFIGSMSGAYCIKKWGMFATKSVGSLLYLGGGALLIVSSFLDVQSPVLLITAMSIVSLGNALAITIYFTYSMTFIPPHLKGSAMSLTQCLRLFLTSSLVWVAAKGFDGTTKPMSLLLIASMTTVIILYVLLYRQGKHVAKDAVPDQPTV